MPWWYVNIKAVHLHINIFLYSHVSAYLINDILWYTYKYIASKWCGRFQLFAANIYAAEGNQSG